MPAASNGRYVFSHVVLLRTVLVMTPKRLAPGCMSRDVSGGLEFLEQTYISDASEDLLDSEDGHGSRYGNAQSC